MPTRAETKQWRALRRRREREATGCFLAEGPKLVSELLDWSGTTVAILYDEARQGTPELDALLRRAADRGVRSEAVEEAWIRGVADAATPQPVVAIGETPAYDWSDIARGPVLLLDGVQDPGNAGALARTAIGLGAGGVIGIGETADPWGPKALRASAGAVFRGPVFRADANEALDRLDGMGFSIWVAEASGSERPAEDAAGLALAVGSEAHGVSDIVRAAAAGTIGISLAAGVESLNVGAAGAILLDRLIGRSD